MKSSQLRPDTHIHPKPRELVKMADSQAPPLEGRTQKPRGCSPGICRPPRELQGSGAADPLRNPFLPPASRKTLPCTARQTLGQTGNQGATGTIWPVTHWATFCPILPPGPLPPLPENQPSKMEAGRGGWKGRLSHHPSTDTLVTVSTHPGVGRREPHLASRTEQDVCGSCRSLQIPAWSSQGPLLSLIPWENFHSCCCCCIRWLSTFLLSPVPLLLEGLSPWSAQPPPPPGSPFGFIQSCSLWALPTLETLALL